MEDGKQQLLRGRSELCKDSHVMEEITEIMCECKGSHFEVWKKNRATNIPGARTIGLNF